MAALEFATPEECDAYARDACAADPALYAEVNRLLQAHWSQGENLLDRWDQRLRATATEVAGNSLGALDDDLIGSSIGPYHVERLIGEGGMGNVYLAQQSAPMQRQVALKVIRPGMDTREVVARFEAERQAIAMMDHPNIAMALDAGSTAQGRPYFVMELVEGQPITDYCAERGLDLAQRLELFCAVCDAVQHAHQRGILHRDLKPSNILVKDVDGVGIPKVIDFGVAKALHQPLTRNPALTQHVQILGTPMYMSPEQAAVRDAEIDVRSDVYALGVLLYELLTSQPPWDREQFQTATTDEMVRIICEQTPVRPSQRLLRTAPSAADKNSGGKNSGGKNSPAGTTSESQLVSSSRRRSLAEMDWIVMKCLMKDRTHRYESPKELARDIGRFQRGEALLAGPLSWRYQLSKFCNRHWPLLTLSTAVLLLVILGSSVAVWQAVVANRARREADLREQQTLELLEAARLKNLLSAFREGDFVTMKSLELPQLSRSPRDALAPSGGNSGSNSVGLSVRTSHGIRPLLLHVARPAPSKTLPHQAAVEDMAVTPDGQAVVTASADGTIRVWDLDSGDLRDHATLSPGASDAVAVSPDGRWVVVGGKKGKVSRRRLNARYQFEGEPRDLGAMATGVEYITWSPDGSHVAAGARYSEFCVWDAEGELVLRINNDQRHESMQFSKDSQSLYVPTRGAIDVWSLSTRERIGQLPTGPLRNVRAMCWGGLGGEWLILGERFGETLVAVDPSTSKVRSMLMIGAAYPQSMVMLDDGRTIAAGFKDGHVRVIHADRTTVSRAVRGVVEYNFAAHAGESARISTLAVVGDRLITAGMDAAVHVWHLPDVEPKRVLAPPFRFGAVATAGEDEIVLYPFDAEPPGPPIRINSQGYNRDLRDEARLGEGIFGESRVNSCGWVALRGERTVQIRALHSGKLVAAIPSPATEPSGLRCAISDDGRRVAATAADDRVHVWESENDWTSWQELPTLPVRAVRTMRFTKDGQTLICDTDENAVLEWNVDSGQEVRRIPFLTGDVQAVSHDESMIAGRGERGMVIVDLKTEQQLFAASGLSQLTVCAFCDDDRVLLTGHRDGRIRAWHLPTRQELGVLFEPTRDMGHPHKIRFFPAGNRLLVVYGQGNAQQLLILGAKP